MDKKETSEKWEPKYVFDGFEERVREMKRLKLPPFDGSPLPEWHPNETIFIHYARREEEARPKIPPFDPAEAARSADWKQRLAAAKHPDCPRTALLCLVNDIIGEICVEAKQNLKARGKN